MELEPAPQPSLPAHFVYDGRRIKFHSQTQSWWSHWRTSPLNNGFTVHDWDYLLETAIVHSRHWHGLDMKAASELRMRMSRFGVTPEDRAKLRIITVDADTREEKAREAAERNARVPIVGESRRLTAI